MNNKSYRMTIDDLTLQIHRVIKDLYPELEISGDNIRKFIVRKNLDLHFQAVKLAVEFKLDTKNLIENIYLEFMVEQEKNWHDKFFFRILKDEEKISFENISQDGK